MPGSRTLLHCDRYVYAKRCAAAASFCAPLGSASSCCTTCSRSWTRQYWAWCRPWIGPCVLHSVPARQRHADKAARRGAMRCGHGGWRANRSHARSAGALATHAWVGRPASVADAVVLADRRHDVTLLLLRKLSLRKGDGRLERN